MLRPLFTYIMHTRAVHSTDCVVEHQQHSASLNPCKEHVALEPCKEAFSFYSKAGTDAQVVDDRISLPIQTSITGEPPEFHLARQIIAGELALHHVSLLDVAKGIQQHMYQDNPYRHEACNLHQKLFDKFC